MLYFSPFRKEIVSFTYMIKSGFFEDFIPFASVYCCLLISFTTIMFMLFHGTDDVVEDFDSFESSLLAMFKLGVGLNDIGMLNQARIQWLAHTIFVVFVVLSFIHLFNALIAVMSQTFSGVHDYRNSYALYNKLRMIELFEDIVLFKDLNLSLTGQNIGIKMMMTLTMKSQSLTETLERIDLKRENKKDRCASILQWSWLNWKPIEMTRKRRKR